MKRPAGCHLRPPALRPRSRSFPDIGQQNDEGTWVAQPYVPVAIQVVHTAMLLGVLPVEYIRLVFMGTPMVAFELMRHVTAFSAGHSRDLDLVEFFCGVAAHTRAFQDLGLLAVGYDVLRDGVFMNLLTDEGFITAITLCMRVKPWSAIWLAIVCSSFSFLALDKTGRSADNPRGSSRSPSAIKGNQLTARSCLLVLICLCRCIWYQVVVVSSVSEIP